MAVLTIGASRDHGERRLTGASWRSGRPSRGKLGRVGLLAEVSEVINRGGERRERGATECGGGEQGLTGDAMVDRPVARQGVDVGVVADSRVGRAEADGRGDFSASTVSMG